MGMDIRALFDISDPSNDFEKDGYLPMGRDSWAEYLMLAVQNGWVPKGVMVPTPNFEDWTRSEKGLESYVYHDLQIVEEDDLAELVKALKKTELDADGMIFASFMEKAKAIQIS
jgi:hypothetical protein